ncbi:MAG: GDSL-type esterase/lipase family protein [Hydrococcus sp. Prado102]|jgi:lysophospholipase L1-like esterase|nr:GDSL-type esterase/lipase family protein [Hydrococcus sp. Prado102]
MLQTFAPSTMTSFVRRYRSPMRIIALGDSLIYGFGDSVGGGWVERLRKHFGHPLYNLGIRGSRVAHVDHRLEQELRRRGKWFYCLSDLIILSVGVHDSPRVGRRYGRTLTNFYVFQSQLANLLDKTKQLAPVVFVGMIPVDEGKMPFLDCLYYNYADQYRYKEATRLACQVRRIPYLDTFDFWMKRGEDWLRSRLCPDGFHPNVKGYETLLEDILNWEPFNQLFN